MSAQTPEADSFLAAYSDDVRALANAARRALAKALPRATESVDRPAKLLGYSYGPGYKGLVCTLIMSKTGVKLGIFRGSELPDPASLMEGSGKVHRYVQLRTASDLERPELKELLAAALAAWRERSAAASEKPVSKRRTLKPRTAGRYARPR
jgi:hypothetical protein